MSVIVPPLEPRKLNTYIIDAIIDADRAGVSGSGILVLDDLNNTPAAIPAGAVLYCIIIDATNATGQLSTTTISIDTGVAGAILPSNIGYNGATFGDVYIYTPTLSKANPADSYITATISTSVVGPIYLDICYYIPSDF